LSSDKYLIDLEIGSSLLIDHLKARLKTKGFTSDGSFSPEIIKLTGEALALLIEEYLDEEREKVIEKRID
jgi:hypothetical protein